MECICAVLNTGQIWLNPSCFFHYTWTQCWVELFECWIHPTKFAFIPFSKDEHDTWRSLIVVFGCDVIVDINSQNTMWGTTTKSKIKSHLRYFVLLRLNQECLCYLETSTVVQFCHRSLKIPRIKIQLAYVKTKFFTMDYVMIPL